MDWLFAIGYAIVKFLGSFADLFPSDEDENTDKDNVVEFRGSSGSARVA